MGRSIDVVVMSEQGAAAVLGVSARTLQRWRVTGTGPTYRKLGRRVGYTAEDIQEYLALSRRTSTSQAAA